MIDRPHTVTIFQMVPVARQVKGRSNRRANISEHEGAVLTKKTEDLLLCVAGDGVLFPQRGR